MQGQHPQLVYAWPSQPLHVVREAVQALSSGVERLQRPADVWLQQFSASSGSWRLCLKLLEAPDVQPNECFFAANTIRTACMKQQDVLEVGILNELLPQLAYHLQASLDRQLWAPANQLAAAVAALAARSPSMHPGTLPQVVCSSLSPAVAQALADASAATSTAAATAAAATAAAAQRQQQQSMQQPQGQWGYSGWHSNIAARSDPAAAAAMASAAAAASARSQEHLQLRLQQEPLVLAALLQVLAALPDVLQSRQALWHSFERREAVKGGLLGSNTATLVVAAALCSQNSRLLVLSCDVLCAMCELGAPPVGLEVQAGALQVLSGALMSSITANKAADALAALANACKAGLPGTIMPPRAQWLLLQQIMQQLQHSVFPTLSSQHSSFAAQGRDSSTGSSPHAQRLGLMGVPVTGGVPFARAIGARFGVNAEAAFCRMLCAVASALLTQVAQGAQPPQGFMEGLLRQLLLCISCEDDGVAMIAVNFFQDEYVVHLQGLPHEQQANALLQQQPILEGLAGALVRRTQLTPAALTTATADARDLPEELRLIRRELAAALRDVGLLVGRQVMLSYMVQLVAEHHRALLAATGGSGGLTPTGDAGALGLSAAAATACCQLEGALYAANVIVGRLCEPGVAELDQMVQQLLVYAAAAASNYTYIHKLAGTALTLLGGLPAWLMSNPVHLPEVMAAAITALRSPDDKLARNAATCVQRLTSCEALAALLFASQPVCVEQLLTEYQRRGGLPVTLAPSVGDDQSTEELLLLALCSIAVAHSSSSNSIADINSILAQLVGPQLNAASLELQAALQGQWPQQLPSVLQAPLPPQSQLRQHKARRGTQTQRQQPHMQSSKAAVCFEAVAKQVAGLPTGVSKYTIGVPMHTRHPRHQRMLERLQALFGSPAPLPGSVQRLQQQHSSGQVATGDVAGVAAAASVSLSAAASETSSTYGSATPAAAAADTPTGKLLALLHVGQGPQQPQHDLQRQQHACLFVSQLLVQSQQVVVLALQTIQQAAAQPETSRFGSQLLAAVSNFLQVALPAALHYHLLTEGSSTSGAGHMQAEVPTSTAGAGPSQPASSPAAAPVVLQPSLLLLQLCQLLERLPAEVLQQTSSLQLLLTIVTCAPLAGVLPEDECLDLEDLPQQPQLPRQHQPDRQQQQLLMLLQRLVGTGLTSACYSIVQQQGAADEEFVAAALSLASASVQQCPAVLVSVDLGLLFSMSLVSARTYHLKQVTALLDWIQIAVFGAYAQVQPVWDAQRGSTLVPAAAAAGAGTSAAGVGFSRSLLAALRVRLEAGMGIQLVLALMMAASGGMPSDVVLPVSLCLHAMWLTVGPQLFQAWLQAAVLQAAPETAPWARVRHRLKVQFLQNLTESSCLADTTKFKGILKSFCGGKKKGPGRC